MPEASNMKVIAAMVSTGSIRPDLLRSYLACILFLLVLFLSGCTTMSDPEASQEYAQDVVASIEPDHAIGQTFTVRRAAINGIYLWLNSKTGAGSLTLKLYATSQATTPLATAPPVAAAPPLAAITIRQSSLVKGGATNIPLALQSPRAGEQAAQSYYLVIQANGGPIEALGRNEDAYTGGSLYRLLDGTPNPTDADLAFRLTYHYDFAALLSDLVAAQPHIWLILPFGVMLVLPGWLLLEFTRLRQHYDAGEQIALSIGLSLALIPLLLLWSTSLNLRWNASVVLIAGIVIAGLSLWRWGVHMAKWQATRMEKQLATPRRFRPQTYLLLLAFIVTLGIRLAMVRDLAAPAWVDSVHHATITRLILNQGRFPTTYLPYLNLNAQEYHAGYHAGLATFVWLSGSGDLAGSMLWYGQVLNALMIFGVYGLARFFTKSQTNGVIAALIVGTLTPMPAYYASWGRYTQLAGLLILPAVIICFQELMSQATPRSQKPGLLALLVIAAGGMFIVHYRVAAYTALLLLVLFVGNFRWNKAANRDLIRQTAAWAAISSVLAFLVASPWAWPALSGVFAPIIASGGASAEVFGDFSWSYLTTAMGIPSLWLAGVGLLWGILRRQRWAAALALWAILLLFMANLGPLGVPGALIFLNNTSVTITFFIPIAIFGGYAIEQAYQAGKGVLPNGVVKLSQIGLSVLLIWLAFSGAQKLLPILRSSTLLFRNADHDAIQWIRANLPPDETVLINPFPWGYNLYAGSDGGFWLSSLAERKSLPPPVLYGMDTAEEIQRINDLCQRVIQNGSNAAQLWEILHEQQMQYVYVGVRGGPISAAALHTSPQFETLYQKNGAWVFQAKPEEK